MGKGYCLKSNKLNMNPEIKMSISILHLLWLIRLFSVYYFSKLRLKLMTLKVESCCAPERFTEVCKYVNIWRAVPNAYWKSMAFSCVCLWSNKQNKYSQASYHFLSQWVRTGNYQSLLRSLKMYIVCCVNVYSCISQCTNDFWGADQGWLFILRATVLKVMKVSKGN